MTRPGAGSDFYRMNGAGEMLIFSAADFEDFLEPRPDLPPSLEGELTRVVRLLAENRWPFRLHATYDESITRFLNVFEAVNRDVPFDGLRWFFDHAETITERNLERVKALGGGIAVQHRMAFQGEYFIDRYGTKAAEQHAADPPDAGRWACRSGRGPTPRAWPATTRSCRCTGWSRARRSAARAVPRGEPPRPHGSPAALHRGQRVVLGRGGQEGLHRGRQAGRPRGAVGGLLLGPRGGDQGHRVGADRGRRQGRLRGRGVRAAGPAAPAGQPRTGRRSRCTAATTRRNPPSPTSARTPACFTSFSTPSPRRHVGWPRAGGRWGCRASASHSERDRWRTGGEVADYSDND